MPVLPICLAVALLAQREPAAASPALAGTWVLVKGSAELPKGVSFLTVFHADGGMLLRFDTGDPKRDTVHKGKYKLDGVKLAYTINTGSGERSETLTVKALTADELVVVDPEGKVEEFHRHVPKKK
jgi:uncharacterized protein (TIGR03066 family)